MEIIITPDRVSAHKVVKYDFKNFDGDIHATKEGASIFATQPPPRSPQIAIEQSAALSSEERETLAAIRAKQLAESDQVANLVKKIESLAENISSLQLRLEKQEQEFADRLDDERKRAFEEGRREGEASATNAMSAEINEQKAQLAESLTKLDDALKEFGEHSASLEKELSSIAVEIAGEVIATEVGENALKIAKSLAAALLSDIKDALKITIKVSPDEFKELTDNFKDDARIKVVADRAVSKGGVVVVSDAGSIDAQLPHRFAAIKKSILEGGAV